MKTITITVLFATMSLIGCGVEAPRDEPGDRPAMAAQGLTLDDPDIDAVALSGAPSPVSSLVTARGADRDLVVWAQQGLNGTDIYGAFVDAVGAPGAPFVIAAEPLDQIEPDVIYNGELQCWTVVWASQSASSGYDIHGARVNNAGVMGAGPFVISSDPADQRHPSIGGEDGGAYYLVAWEDSRNAAIQSRGLDIYAALIDGQGAVMSGPDDIVVSSAPGDQLDPCVTANGITGPKYFVTWTDERAMASRARDIYGARLGWGGSPSFGSLDPNGRLLVTGLGSQESAEIVESYPDKYMLVWREGSSIYGTRLDADYQVLDPAGIFISPGGVAQGAPTVSANVNGFSVFWPDARTSGQGTDIYGTRLDPTGALLYPAGFLVYGGADNEVSPSVSKRQWGTSELVVFTSRSVGSSVAQGAEVHF